MSSTIKVHKINLSSFVCIFPNSVNTLIDITILVAVRAVAITLFSFSDCEWFKKRLNIQYSLSNYLSNVHLLVFI